MATDNAVKELINRMSGNSDVITKRYFDSLVIEQRIIGSDLADMHMDFFGEKLPMPIMMGAIGAFHHLGENALLKSAEAARELGTVLWTTSHLNNDELKEVVDTGVKTAFIVKPFKDQQFFLQRLIEGEKAGVKVLACDIDHAYKNGEYDVQREFMFGPKSVEDLKEVKKNTSIPFIAKGVLSVHDALKCREAGVDGIILSHHHNIYPSAVPPLMVLPEIRKAVGDDYPVFVDCGITSGTEAFKALSLGASGVLVARGYMTPLAKEGKEGVVRYIRQLASETRELMNRTSSSDIRHIDPGVIHKL